MNRTFPARRARSAALYVALASCFALTLITAAPGAAADSFEEVSHPDIVFPGSGPITVFARADGDPVAVQQEKAGRKLTPSEKAAGKAALKSKQDALRSAIAAAGGQIVADFQVALNGFHVRIDASKAGALAGISGVTGVVPVPTIEPDNARGMPFIGVPPTWAGANGFRGEGIKVGVIDSGVDYTHATFGGPGTVAAYDAANAMDTDTPDPLLVGPAAAKVKGGWDFVGDNYNATAAAPAEGQPDPRVPQPDPDPLDCAIGNAAGHGSHVAGTAVGFGVTSNGETYEGAYDASTISSNTWDVGPGSAPKADLYMYRVFGCSGSTNVTDLAIERAVEDGMDVINLSLGSAFGTNDVSTSEAINNAVRAGVVAVLSAGNNGAQQYITGSPGTATRGISVAANDPFVQFEGATITGPGLPAAGITAINANGANWTAPMTAPLRVLRDSLGNVSLGCKGQGAGGAPLPGSSPTEYDDPALAGSIVVSQRGACARVNRAIYAQMAGAQAALMINNSTAFPPFEGKINANADTGAPFDTTIPFFGVRGVLGPAAEADGDLIAAADGNTVTLTKTTITNPAFRAFASFTSGGPRNGDSWLKPDVTAPGVSTTSTAVGTGNRGTVKSGTSMAAPHTAGVMALIRQAHPTWDVADLKAALANTADPAGVASHRISRGGSGLINAERATRTSAVALGNPGTASLSYGFKELDADYSETKTIEVKNLGSAPATFAVAAGTPQGQPHSVALGASTVTVPAGGKAEIGVTLNVPAATAGSSAAYREVAGIVTLTPEGGANNGIALRVPYLLVPRPSSKLATAVPGNFGTARPSATATVTNTGGMVPGTADVYAWGLEDADDKFARFDLRAAGAQAFNAPAATDAGRRFLVFAVNNWNRWSHPSTIRTDIGIDANNDGKDDYLVVAGDQGILTGTGSFDGTYVVAVFAVVYNDKGESSTAGGHIAFLATAPTDSSTMLIPIRIASSLTTATAKQLCLGPAASAAIPATHPCLSTSNPRFTYNVIVRNQRGDGTDSAAGAKFNAFTPSISNGTGPTVAPGASATFPVSINTAEWAQSPALGLMVATADNKSGRDEAQLIRAR